MQVFERLDEIQSQLLKLSASSSAAAEQPVAGQLTSELVSQLVRQEVSTLADSVLAEVRNSVSGLRDVQSAAATSQSEVLRTLTELIFQSSAGQVSLSEIENLLSGFESRLKDHLCEITIERPAAAVPDARAGGKAAPSKSDQKSGSDPKARSWEDIRRDLMRGEAGLPASETDSSNDDQGEGAPGHHSAGSQPQPEHESGVKPVVLAWHETPFEISPAINLDGISPEELKAEFVKREELLTALVSRLRSQAHGNNDLLSADQLKQMMDSQPAELRHRILQTLTRMDEQLRLGELELSLERARIARQLTQLEQTRQVIERNARQLGFTVNPDGTISGNTGNQGKGSSSRRWLGVLGFRE